MQRPRSEGRRPAPHTQSRSRLVTRSLQFGTGDHRDRSSNSDLGEPRRPNTTPKPRIQRLLPAPGQNASQEWRQTPLSTLTRLPDSPPRSLSIRFTECFSTPKEMGSSADIEHFGKEEGPSSPIPPRNTGNTSDSSRVSIFGFQTTPESVGAASPSWPLIAGSCSSNNEDNSSSGSNEYAVSSSRPKPEPHQESRQTAEVLGPLLADLHGEEASTDSLPNQDEEQSTDDDEYKQVLADRARFLDDEVNRQRVREELETYVGSLSSRMDENGEHLVEFPRNYQQIVSLMTEKDVRESDAKPQDGKSTRQSWSRVLIESGLSKQQAFGILEDGDDDPEGKGSLAAKIALKMAHIRQLDTILEEKLGKNLYASIAPRKQKRAQSPPQPDPKQESSSRVDSSSRTFVTQTRSLTATSLSSRGSETSRSSSGRLTNDDTLPCNQDVGINKTSNFIERNKQVVANGMKANMTKDEEDRLERLLQDETGSDGDDTASSEPAGANPQDEAAPRRCNEFTMNEDEKRAIEELIASKSSAYPLFAIDELQDGPTDDALLLHGDSTRPVKSNIIQETKRERLQRQRLSRVEQELRFLEDCPSVVIVGDEHDEDEDCRSERSYATVASSTCSTRSGVISRHDFKCFLAQQKETFQATPTASAEEIRRLLLSMGHGTSASSDVVTATTG